MLRSVTVSGSIFAILAGALALATPTKAADFSCDAATLAAEQTICADPRLSRLDDRMAITYGRLWAVAGTRERLALRSAQQRFLGYRNSCNWDARCIRDAYLDQIGVLDNRLVAALDR